MYETWLVCILFVYKTVSAIICYSPFWQCIGRGQCPQQLLLIHSINHSTVLAHKQLNKAARFGCDKAQFVWSFCRLIVSSLFTWAQRWFIRVNNLRYNLIRTENRPIFNLQSYWSFDFKRHRWLIIPMVTHNAIIKQCSPHKEKCTKNRYL